MNTKNIYLLAVAYALNFCGPPIVLLVGGIVGAQLAPTQALATLPISMMVIGQAVMTIPAALIMRRIGRRPGFIGSAILGALASLLAAYALYLGNFWLFSLAILGIGANSAFGQQYRFAASESVNTAQVGRAVSLVLVGGVVAGFLGPELGKQGRDWLDWGAYTGSFIVLAGLYLSGSVLLTFFHETAPGNLDFLETSQPRPLRAVILQPLFLTAVFASAAAYGVMSHVMTATPLQMHSLAGHSLDHTTLVIQSHIIAMFLPSLITGHLIERFGVKRILLSGALLLLAATISGAISQEVFHYWWALVLLGVGWNFLFVGGTTLLTYTYRPDERFKAQAVNDFTVFGIQAIASLTAGTMLFASGWLTLNLLMVPVLVGLLLVLWVVNTRDLVIQRS
jgi:MFS family permease